MMTLFWYWMCLRPTSAVRHRVYEHDGALYGILTGFTYFTQNEESEVRLL